MEGGLRRGNSTKKGGGLSCGTKSEKGGGGLRRWSGKKAPPPPLVWNYAGLAYDEPQLSSLELAKFRIFSNVCFAGVGKEKGEINASYEHELK